jgi:hypothetical protein
MALNQLSVGAQGPSNTGATITAASGPEGEQVAVELHGKYYEAARRGRLFFQSVTSLGVAVPIATTTAPILTLWNPTGSGKNAVLVRLSLAYVSGTTVAGGIGLNWTAGAGSSVGTGQVFTAFNNVTPANALLGAGNTSVMNSSNAATNTLTTAMTKFIALGLSEYAAVAASAIDQTSLIYDFDGTVVVPPGVAIAVVASAASGALLQQTLYWEEVTIST